jgi:hypothetical protein
MAAFNTKSDRRVKTEVQVASCISIAKTLIAAMRRVSAPTDWPSPHGIHAGSRQRCSARKRVRVFSAL